MVERYLPGRGLLAGVGFAFSAAAAATITHLPGVNLERAAAQLAGAHRLPLFGAFVLFVASLAFSAFAWRSAVGECGGRLGRTRSAAFFGVGSLVNSLTPARLGDAVRIALFSRGLPGQGRLWAGGGIFAAMSAFQGVSMIILVATAAWLGAIPPWAVALPAAPAVVAVVLARRAKRRGSRSGISRLLDVFAAFGRSPRHTCRPVGWLTVALCCRICAAALTATAFGMASSVTAAIVLIPAVEIATLLPLTPGNLGLTSAAVAVALHTTGTSLTRAVAVGIGFHAAEMAAGLAYGLASTIYLLGVRADSGTFVGPAPAINTY
ncbi:MAG: lysylphosphatidylglycerol synthase domain-containing protein [Gaiellaceae bacterium]